MNFAGYYRSPGPAFIAVQFIAISCDLIEKDWKEYQCKDSSILELTNLKLTQINCKNLSSFLFCQSRVKFKTFYITNM